MSLEILKERLKQVRHPLAKKVLDRALHKKSNLCLSLDVTKVVDFLRIVEQLGPYIVMLKTHIDILDDFNIEVIHKLKDLAKKHDFLIFEDRKFADIGNTVKYQYGSGIYRIADWADFVTIHALPGEGIIDGLKEVGLPLNRAGFMLVQMSSKGGLFTPDYQKAAISMSQKHADFIAGFIAQERFQGCDEFLYCTPGINLTAKGDTTGQQYKTPEAALQQGSDILIVGRGIYQAEDPVAEAKKYLEAITSRSA